MLQTFSQIARNVKIKAKLVSVDNFVFQLHYRYTFWLLLVCTVLVSSRQYIGEHIRCITDTIKSNVIDTYCFFTTTFTVVKHLNGSQVAHPGVGPLSSHPVPWEEPVIHHAYYQWVPFVLFAQAMVFHLPHIIWRAIESHTVRSLVDGLEHAYLSVREDVDFKSAYGVIPSKQRARKQVNRIRTAFLTRLHVNRWWGYQLMCCEVLNLTNIIMQIFITDAFLGGWFLNLGPFVSSPPDGLDGLDVVFPKVTKCTFQKFGPSGTIQQHDALCVMALNIINEKIYLFLWYWFIFVAVVSILGLVWRLLTMLLHARSVLFSKWVFRWAGLSNIDQNSFRTVMENCLFSDWLFLYYLTKNLHGYATAELFNDLAVEMQEMRKSGSRRWQPNGHVQEDAIPLRQAEPTPERTPEPEGVPPGERPHTE